MNPAGSRAQFSSGRITWVVTITTVIIVGLISLAFYFNPISLIHRRSHHFFVDAQQNIDPEELRIWAAKLASKHAFESKPNASELPSKLMGLSAQPPSICICATNACGDQPYVMLIYGGGFYHWGIDIGPTNFVRSNDSVFTTMKWVPGIYFRHEGND